MHLSTGNRLGDDGFHQLIKVLPTLPNIRLLDVSSNAITHMGLNALADVLSSSDTQEPTLQVISVQKFPIH